MNDYIDEIMEIAIRAENNDDRVEFIKALCINVAIFCLESEDDNDALMMSIKEISEIYSVNRLNQNLSIN